MERNRVLTDEERFSNARKAIENGRRATREAHTLFDLRTHYKAMSRSFARGGADHGKR